MSVYIATSAVALEQISHSVEVWASLAVVGRENYVPARLKPRAAIGMEEKGSLVRAQFKGIVMATIPQAVEC
jgi:hypothetical protein